MWSVLLIESIPMLEYLYSSHKVPFELDVFISNDLFADI